ncbi:MAG TPA: hypothetical protein PKU94_05295 [Candidatus Hydrothermia bacterium]|nr:hypothetical protein [Candidatus Hydrothermae bacterium]HOP32775.1 hypothetical protein [Candidatus Hydrothermia bacterium]
MILLLLCIQMPHEATIRGILDIEIKKGIPPIVIPQIDDSVRQALKAIDVIELEPETGTIPELKRIEISYNELLSTVLSQITIEDGRRKLKEAINRGASDEEIIILKLETEKRMLEQHREIAKLEGKDEELLRIQMRLNTMEKSLKELKEELK